MARSLTAEGRYLAVLASCEMGQSQSGDVEAGVAGLLRSLERQGRLLPAGVPPPPIEEFAEIEPKSRLNAVLTAWSERSPLPVVLFLDEIDVLHGEALFAVLRQLREGYADRPRHFPQALGLIGLRDVRDYRIEPGGAVLGSSSPFNIKVESLLLPNFEPAEVAALLAQHSAETGQEFTADAAARIAELTGGQPWLVNALARQLVEKVAPGIMTIGVLEVEQAREILILRRDTHLDSLVDRLREPRVQRVIEPILVGEAPSADVLDDDVAFAEDLGLVRSGPQGLEIANPIYREIIPRALAALTQAYLPQSEK